MSSSGLPSSQPRNSASVGEILSHLAGDYVAQSSWMAAEKLHRHGPAAAHAITYTACFLPVTRNWRALAVIGGTHFVIDRWRLAKYLCWAKNQAAPARWRYPWTAAGPTGYFTDPERAVPAVAAAEHLRMLAKSEVRHLAMAPRRGGKSSAAEAIGRILGPTGEKGYDRPPPVTPDGLATGLLIVADNACHLIINRWALGRWAR